jgi:hypothetical protein
MPHCPAMGDRKNARPRVELADATSSLDRANTESFSTVLCIAVLIGFTWASIQLQLA